MKKKIFFWILIQFVFVACISQTPDQLLNNWSAKSPIEKIYLHLDRENYIAGETVWFKAYLYSDYQPDTISTSVYVELLNKASAIISRKVLPVFLGNTNGQIELPDSLLTGNYTIRAYTLTMMNQDPAFLYKKNVFIYGQKDKSGNSAVRISENLQIEFFPEGGNLVSGVTNTIAFKATDSGGLPLDIKGVLRSEKKEITSFVSYHDGMGMFELMPLAGEKYYVEIDEDTSHKKYYLPEQTDKGIALSIIPHPQGNFFEIRQKRDDLAFIASYMIGQMQHHVVFKQEFHGNSEQMQGVINTQNLNSGILQVTIFNKDNAPLAERLCFVDNKEYLQEAKLIADTLDFKARQKNHFSIVFKDTIQANISVSVSDAELLSSSVRTDNIFSSLLLTSDLKGYVYNPAYYFADTNDSVKTALDLLMMTNGWRRFKWTESAKKVFPSAKDNRYITLSGKVNIRGTKKPFADKQVLLMIMGTIRKRSPHLLQTDNQGKFFIDSLLFFDKNRLLFTDIRGKKSQYIDVALDADSLHKIISLPHSEGINTQVVVGNYFTKWQMDYDAILKAEGLMLEAVTVKVHRKSAMEELQERYTTGLFGGNASSAIDLVNNPEETTPYQNVFEYLQFRVPGLQIFRDGLDYSIFYRQVATVSSMGNIPMTLFLDEVETDASFISAIPANQIALVKIFSSFAGAAGNAPGAVLAIYTKKGADYVSSSGFANLSFYNGYSVIKEFYSPDYKLKQNEDKPDTRITLAWRPDIFVNAANARIPVAFYNNDRTKKYKVVVEGITVSGKIICIEKTISPGHKGF